MEQWNAIAKGKNWDLNLVDYVVNCKDGVIEKGDTKITKELVLYIAALYNVINSQEKRLRK